MANAIEYQGKAYRSLRALVDAVAPEGLSYAAVYARIKSGQSVEEALSFSGTGLTRQSVLVGEKDAVAMSSIQLARRTYVVDGAEFPTLKALAESAGITYEAAVKRAHRGYTDREIFHGKKRLEVAKLDRPKRARGNQVIVLGIEYENIRVAHEALKPDISLNSVNGRLRLGWSVEEALGIVARTDGRITNVGARVLNLAGELLNAKQAAEKYGVSYDTVLYRLRHGASPEQAVGIVPINSGDLLPWSEKIKERKKTKKPSYRLNGKEYPSITAIANEFGLSPALVSNRVNQNGWSLERAVSEPVHEQVTVEGVIYRSALNAWQHVGVTSLAAFSSRRASKLPIEVCLGLAPLPPLQRYDIDGRMFSTLSEVAEAYDMAVGTLNTRLQTMSLDEAVTYAPIPNGRYSRKRFDDDPKLAGTSGCLYFVRISLAEGMLHKIGITQKDVASRFSGKEFHIIAVFDGMLANTFELEQLAIKALSEFHYRADNEFDGRTETFLMMPDEEQYALNYLRERAATFGLSKSSVASAGQEKDEIARRLCR